MANNWHKILDLLGNITPSTVVYGINDHPETALTFDTCRDIETISARLGVSLERSTHMGMEHVRAATADIVLNHRHPTPSLQPCPSASGALPGQEPLSGLA